MSLLDSVADLSLAGVAEVGAVVLVATLVLVLVASFVWEFVLTRDPAEAGERASQRAGGTLVGAGALGTGVAVGGVELLAQMPEVVLTLLGVGALVSGWSWELFAAVAVVVWIATEAVAK